MCSGGKYADLRIHLQQVVERKEGGKRDMWWLLIVLVLWVLLQAVILPRFGIST
jgi:hypothetical protein